LPSLHDLLLLVLVDKDKETDKDMDMDKKAESIIDQTAVRRNKRAPQ
jgi:hypothetical protein